MALILTKGDRGMTEQELEIIKTNMFIERHEELEDAVIEAVEKQVPKKPCKDNDNGIYEKDCCPTCHRSLFPNDHHCRCGQAIDFSEESK